MPRNSSGTYSLPLPPVIDGTTIEAAWANQTLADMAQALTDSLDREGRGGMNTAFRVAFGTAALPAFAFTAATGTGMNASATTLDFSVNGTLAGSISSAGWLLSSPLVVTGAVTPNANNAHDLGSTTQRWRDLFLGGAVNAASAAFSGSVTANQFNGSTFGSGGNILITAPVISFQNSSVLLQLTGASLRPATDGAIDLGGGSNRFASVYGVAFYGSFNGNLNGNATTATTATNATNATNAGTASVANTLAAGGTSAGLAVMHDPGADSQSIGIGGIVLARADLGAANQPWGTAVAMSGGVATLTLFTSSGGTPTQTIAYGTWRFLGNAQGANGMWVRVA